MTPDKLAHLIRSAAEECKADGESMYGLRLLAHNAAVEFYFDDADFDRDEWIRDCGLRR